MSHDAINRYLREDRLTSRLVWENVHSQLQVSRHGYTVLDKNFPHKIYYCSLKDNRQVDDSGGEAPYRRMCELL